jgi:nuclear pore complex protein Nup205
MFSHNMCLKHVQGALRNSIAAFIKVSPLLKDTIWSYLEQYDLPVVTAPLGHHAATQVPDVQHFTNFLILLPTF